MCAKCRREQVVALVLTAIVLIGASVLITSGLKTIPPKWGGAAVALQLLVLLVCTMVEVFNSSCGGDCSKCDEGDGCQKCEQRNKVFWSAGAGVIAALFILIWNTDEATHPPTTTAQILAAGVVEVICFLWCLWLWLKPKRAANPISTTQP